MSWDLDQRFVLDMVQWVFTGVLAAAVWLRKPGEDAAQAVAKLAAEMERRLLSHADRIKEVETELKHFPTADHVRQLEVSVRQIEERTRYFAEGMNAMRHTLTRIEDWLRQGSSHP